MQARLIWWFVAFAIVGAGIAAIVKLYSEHDIDYQLPLSLVATLVCGGLGLAGLALLDRGVLRFLGLALLVTAVVTYVLLELGTWDNGFSERHPRVVATAAVVAAFGVLLGTLAAIVRAAPRLLRVLTLAAQTVIVATAAYTISLVWTVDALAGPSRSEGRTLELLVIVTLVGYFVTPVVQRALRPPPPDPSPI